MGPLLKLSAAIDAVNEWLGKLEIGYELQAQPTSLAFTPPRTDSAMYAPVLTATTTNAASQTLFHCTALFVKYGKP